MLFSLAVIAAIVAVAIIIVRAVERPAISGRFPEIVQMYGDLFRWRIKGLVAGGILAFVAPLTYVLIFGFDSLAPIALGAPTGFATGYLASLALGERSAFAPVSERRTAALTRRSTQRYVSRPMLAVTTITLVAAAAATITLLRFTNPRGLFVFACDGQSPGDIQPTDWESRAGITSTMNTTGAQLALACIAVVTLAALWVVTITVRRARPNVDLLSFDEDDALRRATVRTALGTAVSCIAFVGAICTYAIATVLDTEVRACAAPSWWATMGTVLLWSELVWGGLFMWSVAQIAARPTSNRRSANIG